MPTNPHETAIQAKQDALSTDLGILLKVSIKTLKKHGVYEAYIVLRPNVAALADEEYDYLYIAQAQSLGLIPR